MLSPRKVRAMTQTELFEHREGREILKLKSEYEEQPVWNGMVMHTLTGLLLFILLAILSVLSAPEWFIDLYNRIGNLWAAIIVVVVMAVFSIVYSLISEQIFRRRYLRLRSTLCGYSAKRRLLERLEQEQDV